MRIVSFSGPSNSGKTTLIVKLVELLKPAFNITVIKNDPKNKAVFDTKGKDSYNFFESGANVLVTSRQKVSYFAHKRHSIKKLLKMCKGSDLVFIEGLRYLKTPTIGVFRDSFNYNYTPYINAIASKQIDTISLSKTLNEDDVKNIKMLDLDDIEQIASWIYDNAKTYKQIKNNQF